MIATDKQDVDPALWPLVESFPPVEVSTESLSGFRQAMVDLSVKPDPATHADVRVDEVQVPGGGAAAAQIRCLLLKPADAPAAAALLHIHGGGFVMGSPEMDVARNIELVRATGCAILSVDYRLAPEHPHPAGLEDCHAALVWLSQHVATLGIGSARIGVIGESAGGGLAASLALLARDRSSVALVCQVLVYPMLMPPGHSIDAIAPDPRIGQYIWTRGSNTYCWSANLSGKAADAASIAGLAKDVARLPPAFLAVGQLDLFLHDDLAYVSRLHRAGVDVEAHVYPGAIHGFDRMTEADVSQRYARDLAAFIRRHLG